VAREDIVRDASEFAPRWQTLTIAEPRVSATCTREHRRHIDLEGILLTGVGSPLVPDVHGPARVNDIRPRAVMTTPRAASARGPVTVAAHGRQRPDSGGSHSPARRPGGIVRDASEFTRACTGRWPSRTPVNQRRA